jgi:deoxyribonuclease V
LIRLSCRKEIIFRRICCVDSSYDNGFINSVAVLSERDKVVDMSYTKDKVRFPYFPGLFFLREGPSSVSAVRKLKKKPDVVCFDAHGRIHPREAGLATICGAILGIPSIGLAKSRFIGKELILSRKVSKVVLRGKTLGYITRVLGRKRYWSPGFCFNNKMLLEFVQRFGEITVRMMSLAHKEASSRKEA